MWNGKTIAVVLPTYREKATIRGVIEEFESLGIVDDMVVVNNNAEEGTSEEVAPTSAREVFESQQGYGASIRRGLQEADADLICVFEPDGTFVPADIFKLLAYSVDFDFVYGSRTVPDFIWSGANMGYFLRWGNWAVAKLVELLFNTPSLSDVGCTMRVVSGPVTRALLPFFTVTDGAFGPEMMVLSIVGGWRVVQLPVNYKARPRSGQPGTTESFTGAFAIGLQMIRLVFRYHRHRKELASALRRAAAARDGWSDADEHPGGEPTHMFWRPSWGRRKP